MIPSAFWICEPCREKWPLTWPDPGDSPPPDCMFCGKPTVLKLACVNCHGEGWCEATQVCPPNAGPCPECRGRGWLDDLTLYEALGDGVPADNRVGDKAAMLRNCERYLERRCQGGGWPTYAELEAERDRLRAALDLVSRCGFTVDTDAGCVRGKGVRFYPNDEEILT